MKNLIYEIKIESTKIKDLIQKKGDLVVKGRALNKQKEDIGIELNKVSLQINKLGDKIIPLVRDINVELGEFEQIQDVQIVDGELVMTIFDMLEDYKEKLIKAKQEAKDKEEGKGDFKDLYNKEEEKTITE